MANALVARRDRLEKAISIFVELQKFRERYRNWRGFVLDDLDRWRMLDSEGNLLEFLKNLPPIDPAESGDDS